MDTSMSLVTFKISNELYGINIMEVREIIRFTDITPIPNSPEFVDGVITIRGEIIPIVDLGKRFHFESVTFTEDEELLRGIIVIVVEDMTIGVLIDQVNRVITINSSQIQPPPHMISGIGSEYIQGVVKLEENLLVILNINKLFNKERTLFVGDGCTDLSVEAFVETFVGFGGNVCRKEVESNAKFYVHSNDLLTILKFI